MLVGLARGSEALLVPVQWHPGEQVLKVEVEVIDVPVAPLHWISPPRASVCFVTASSEFAWYTALTRPSAT